MTSTFPCFFYVTSPLGGRGGEQDVSVPKVQEQICLRFREIGEGTYLWRCNLHILQPFLFWLHFYIMIH